MKLSGLTSTLAEEDRCGWLSAIRQQNDDGSWMADLRVDQADPFFFDHPLDHVPGTLLVCAMVELARQKITTPDDRRVKGTMTFRAIGELKPAPVLHIGPPQAGRRNMFVTQESSVVADGWFEFSSEPGPAWIRQEGAGERLPAQAALVHRTRPENVMIGEPSLTYRQVTGGVVSPPDGHALSGHRADVRPIEALIEAGRQLSTWLSHRFGGWPLDTQILWVGVTADLPVALPRSLPVSLRWKPAPISRNKAEFHFDVVADDAWETVLGSLVYASKAVRPDVYARFRANRSAT